MDAAVAERDRANADVNARALAGWLSGEPLATARRNIEDAFQNAMAAALAEYLKTR